MMILHAGFQLRMVCRVSIGAALLVLFSGCATEIVPYASRPSGAHELYERSLERAGLEDTALVRGWSVAAGRAVEEPVEVEVPFREAGYFDIVRPDAIGYRFSALRGQKILIVFEMEETAGTKLFADLFRIEEGSEPGGSVRAFPAGAAAPPARAPGRAPVNVASRGSTSNRIEFEPRRDGVYVFRLQPEILRGGRFTVSITGRPSLPNPVEGGTVGNIISVFGDPRDGGTRGHEGVDIAAPRGTPVLAPVRAYVSRVERTRIGGKVVWLRDPERGFDLYFAHLDRQSVKAGSWVDAGEMIGMVGNTGNAAGTPPHLHLGIYARGDTAIDPLPYITSRSETAVEPVVDLARLGTWARVRSAGDHARGVPVFITGGSAGFYRAMMPDGRQEYVAADRLEPAGIPLGLATLGRDSVLFSQPTRASTAIGKLAAGSELGIYGTYGAFSLVKTVEGRQVWIELPES